MKILMMSPFYYPHTGGTEKYVRDLSIALVEKGHDVTIMCANLPFSKRGKKEEVKDGVKIVRFPAFELLYLPIAFGFKRKMTKDFDIIHVHCPPYGFVREMAGKVPQPVVATFHCDITLTGKFFGIPVPRVVTWLLDTFGKFYATRHLPKVDEIITTTESYAAGSPVMKDFPRNPIPIGIHYDKIDKVIAEEGIDVVKKKAGQILFLGRLAANKGVNFLIKAMPKILEKHPEAKLVITGEGEEKKSLVSLIKKLGIESYVTFYGIIDFKTLVRLYAESNMFVLPSINSLEAFGIVQLEAMACSTPVVASDIRGVNSVAGKGGLIAPKEDPSALADAIITILDNPQKAREMGIEGRKLVETKYVWPLIVKQVEAVYKKAMDKKKGK
ncbi:glycosyltransferase family 4 protein [Candidatus Margulisiibacteriota bacterium]